MRSRSRRAAELDFHEAILQLARERRAEDVLHAPASVGSGPASPADARRPLFSHVSSGVEIAYVITGAVLVVTPAQLLRLTPARVLVMDRGVQHAELPGNSRRPHQTFWCHLYQTRAHLAHSRFTPPRSLSAVSLDLPGRTNLERIGQAVCAELSTSGWGSHRAASALLTYLACVIARRIRRGRRVHANVPESPAPIGGDKAWLAIQSAVAFCDANFRKRIGRADVARAAGYSPSYLGHLVSTCLGHSLSEYLSNLRITEGKRLLEETDLTVREVASSVGYADPAHFTRAFARVTGFSPTAYRRQLELF